MGKKKTLREVLYRHPDLDDLVQLLSSGDGVLASEEASGDGQSRITLSRDGKLKKKRRNEFSFQVTAEGYLLLRTPTPPPGDDTDS